MVGMQGIARQNSGFGFKNAALIMGVAMFLIYAAYSQSPQGFASSHFSLFNPVSSKNGSDLAYLSPPKPFDLTLSGGPNTGVEGYMLAQNSQLHPQAQAQSEVTSQSLAQASQSQAEQSAVLGTSTYDKNFAAQFNSVPLDLSADNSASALQIYAGQVRAVVAGDNADALLQNAKKFPAKTGELTAPEQKFIRDFQAITVPDSLLDYARMFIGNYALQFVGDSKLDSTISQANAELGIIRSQAKQNSGVVLP